MPYLLLVRHGQPDFAGNYDSLTELGLRQSTWLGQHLRDRGTRITRVMSGTLRRQVDTCDAILRELTTAPAPARDARLNEYDHASLLQFFEGDHVQTLRRAGDRKGYFIALRAAMYAWAGHDGTVAGGETWHQFGARAHAAMLQACAGLTRDDRVLMVSSGGIIGRLVASVLDAGDATAIELNLQIRNTGVTEIVVPANRPPRLVTFNGTPHLERADREYAMTHS
jgi:broad specificity phosphatase PhoE